MIRFIAGRVFRLGWLIALVMAVQLVIAIMSGVGQTSDAQPVSQRVSIQPLCDGTAALQPHCAD